MWSPNLAPAGPVFGMNFGPACRWVGVRVFPGGAARRHEFRPHPGFDLGVGVFAAALGVGRVRSKVELFEQIRRDRRMEELSTRALAVRHQVHRRTVREALGNAVPLPRKPYVARVKPGVGGAGGGDRRRVRLSWSDLDSVQRA